ncbi:hypothetical protein H5410_005821 [Solanum commersonii]|uniref:Uncharacterized protein n=1 Tax=Solanum commersonii TaxID=4109 RepID=A0A9J6A8J4_SOLCO|nr:hypothetical protein H5410_005821 [Solanum commersonii]
MNESEKMAGDPRKGGGSHEELASLFETLARSLTLRWDIVLGGAFRRNAAARHVILWLARSHSFANGGVREWVADSAVGHRKATLTFVAKPCGTAMGAAAMTSAPDPAPTSRAHRALAWA